MATADVQTPTDPTPALPDYVTDPDAVLKDQAHWRYGRAPDYSKTRQVFAKSKYFHLQSLVDHPVACINVSVKPWIVQDRTRLTRMTSQDYVARGQLPSSARGESGQKLGSRSVVQTYLVRLAYGRSRKLLLRHQWLRASECRAHAQARHVQCHHRSERVLFTRVLRLCQQPQDVQTDDANICVGSA
jgi:hypothetical protein